MYNKGEILMYNRIIEMPDVLNDSNSTIATYLKYLIKSIKTIGIDGSIPVPFTECTFEDDDLDIIMLMDAYDMNHWYSIPNANNQRIEIYLKK